MYRCGRRLWRLISRTRRTKQPPSKKNIFFTILVITTFIYVTTLRAPTGNNATASLIESMEEISQKMNTPRNRSDYDLLEDIWGNKTLWMAAKEVNINGMAPLSGLSDDLTVVSAFFNIGRFPKGAIGNDFTPELYRKWMTSYARLENPVVIYIDNKNDLDYFLNIRRQRFPANRTRAVLVNRTRLWTFSQTTVDRVTQIFSQRGYPRHYPNTVVPAYSLAMHAKYELVQMSARWNPFSTRYICWLDIGLFRDFTEPNVLLPNISDFSLYLPPNFTHAEQRAVAVCEVYDRTAQWRPQQIVAFNAVWIGGGFFVGRVDVVSRWTAEYLDGVQWMMNIKHLSTDQQVIYSMLNAADQGLRPKPVTELLRYRDDGRFHQWFHLAYVAREQGALRKARSEIAVKPDIQSFKRRKTQLFRTDLPSSVGSTSFSTPTTTVAMNITTPTSASTSLKTTVSPATNISTSTSASTQSSTTVHLIYRYQHEMNRLQNLRSKYRRRFSSSSTGTRTSPTANVTDQHQRLLTRLQDRNYRLRHRRVHPSSSTNETTGLSPAMRVSRLTLL